MGYRATSARPDRQRADHPEANLTNQMDVQTAASNPQDRLRKSSLTIVAAHKKQAARNRQEMLITSSGPETQGKSIMRPGLIGSLPKMSDLNGTDLSHQVPVFVIPARSFSTAKLVRQESSDHGLSKALGPRFARMTGLSQCHSGWRHYRHSPGISDLFQIIRQNGGGAFSLHTSGMGSLDVLVQP